MRHQMCGKQSGKTLGMLQELNLALQRNGMAVLRINHEAQLTNGKALAMEALCLLGQASVKLREESHPMAEYVHRAWKGMYAIAMAWRDTNK